MIGLKGGVKKMQQLKEIRDISNLIMERWYTLNARAELLRPALVDKKLVQRFNSSGQDAANGFDHLRMALTEICLINAIGLLSSPDSSDACIGSFITKLNDNKDPVYKTLREDFSKPAPYTFSKNSGLTSVAQAELKKRDEEEERTRKEKQFDQTCKEITRCYDDLMQKGIGKKIKTIRNKVLAHFGTRHNGQKRVLQNTTDFNLIVKDIFKIVQQIGLLARKCELVICNTGWPLSDDKKLHAQQSKAFWKF